MSELEDPNILYGGDIPDDFTGGFKSLGALIYSECGKGKDNVAFVDGNSEKQITFNEIKTLTLKLAASMHEWGIRQGDVVAVISENCIEFPALIFATIYLGAVAAPMNILYTKRELEHSLSLSSPKFIFASDFVADKVIKNCNRTITKKIVIVNGKTRNDFAISMKDFIKSGKSDDGRNLVKEVDIYKQVAFILNSSGTTGLPKGVQITHANLMTCWFQGQTNMELMEAVYEKKPTMIGVGPWFHTYGLVIMFVVGLHPRVKMVFLPQFKERLFLSCIEKYKIDIAICVPPIMVFLAKSPLVDQYDLSSLKELGCGAAALSKEVEEAVMKRFGDTVQIRQGYGMSESTFGVIGQVAIKKLGSVGQVVPGIYIKVIDENGKTLGPHQRGELCFKGVRIMKGYIGNDAATTETIKDGWLHSGDIAYYDEDEQFFIVDRIKELIKYKGFQSAPAEIEAILLSHPKIKDAGVIGIPDEECGELPLAYVVKQPDVNLSEKEVIDFVASLASKPKHLHGGVRFIEEIPKNPSGKILRKDLREMFKKTHLNAKL